MQGVIHDVTILHNIKLMRELVKEKCRECKKRLANLYKRFMKLSNEKLRKFNSRKTWKKIKKVSAILLY
ncbi:hypothetical protein MSBR3_2481 [Methanosarcina barkeri 3]|uniref:Uncharacterized protein n=2 Tax=Methanosarcina barkeri TaxID=2208 RepID=A0A0E3WZ44_METBA|nr:hypothetical protein MSBR3_2481 [Methanosarcina barkeri 3]